MRTLLQLKRLRLNLLWQSPTRSSRKSFPSTSRSSQKWNRQLFDHQPLNGFVFDNPVRPVTIIQLLCFKNLPIPDEMKSSRGSESPIRVVDLVFSSGESRKWVWLSKPIVKFALSHKTHFVRSVQTIAFNLPNDERVRKEKGAKKVMLRNLIAAKFKTILKPIATTLMKKKQLPLLSQDAFFNNVLFHELSHSLGPAFVGNDEANGEVGNWKYLEFCASRVGN